MTREEVIAVLEESKRQNEVMRDNPSTFTAARRRDRRINMKFKSPDGKVFPYMSNAVAAYCDERECSDCPIGDSSNEQGETCNYYATHHPDEAARLMGYEIVEDEQTDAQADPLTLDELRGMVGCWVWVIVTYQHEGKTFQCDGWALVETPARIAYLDQEFQLTELGTRFHAYRHQVSDFRVRVAPNDL